MSCKSESSNKKGPLMLVEVNICNLLVQRKRVKQCLTFKYTHPKLLIGLNSWRDVYLLQPKPEQLFPEVHRGTLSYRAEGSQKRISYTNIKAGLVKKTSRVELEVSIGCKQFFAFLPLTCPI